MAVNNESWFTEKELHAVTPPPFLIEGVIPLRSVNMLFGEFNVGKTFVAMDMAAHIASDKQWLGKPTMGGDVLYIAAEGDPGNMGLRMEAWRLRHEVDYPVDLLFYTDVVSLVHDAPTLLQGAIDRGLRPRLIIVDTLAMALDENENDNHVMTSLIKSLRKLQEGEADGETWEIAWLLIHHTGWEKGRPRGGSSMPAGLDYIMGMEPLTEDTVRLFHYKAKNSAKFKDIIFEPVAYGDSIVFDYVPADRAAKLKKAAGTSNSAAASREFPEWLERWDPKLAFSRATYQQALKAMKVPSDKKAVSAAFEDHEDLYVFDHKQGNEKFYTVKETK